ncbi:carnitine dehydratase [Microbacterium sp. SYP-A9085]|uniref:CoA transferase n=1 Tax=Microbacterium sp. SYP-A9085 TaxID=2664454 RepID=UPI00129BAA8B|nr:CoA transferase [Microbacterium sp. SYP-A9085]MRH29205.1 carnitine dehydratase [Microbacterium sp. SYP-A9085]
MTTAAAILGELGLASAPAVEPARPVPLPARTAVAELAWAGVSAASAAAAALAGAPSVRLDPDRIALAYASEKRLLVDGEHPEAFAALSGFFRAADGWVRTHGNYPHHAAALRRGLGLGDSALRDDVAAALQRLPAAAAAERVTGAGGLCVVVRAEDPARDARLRTEPLIDVRSIGAAPASPRLAGSADAPLRGIRILDLTRVIAGPVGTRTLALLGAEVLRIDPPGIPEIAAQHLDTGHGKRSALLNLSAPADRARFDELLRTADVVALGYRATSLARLGLSPDALIRRRPGLVVAQHTAWADPDRRGFDSLVQAACGIAVIEGAADAPGVLPAQALDHTTGYLLAAGVMAALARRAAEGGSWLVATSLRRVAAELLGMPRTAAPPASTPIDPAPHVQEFDVAGSRVTTVGPAVGYAGGPTAFAAPRPWGGDRAAWLDR